MFYLTNVLYDLGVGGVTLRDVHFLGFALEPRLGPAFAILLTAAASLGWALLTGHWLAGLSRPLRTKRVFCVLAFLLLLAGSLLQARYYFDRYLLPIIPFALAAALASEPRLKPRAASWLLLAAIAAYGVTGTHDYMAWNRARHAGLEALAGQGFTPREIDGGMEYNAWHLAPVLGSWPSDEEIKPGQPASRKSWWWVVDDRFVASFRPLDGYRVKQTLPYRRWLPPGDSQVLILERES